MKSLGGIQIRAVLIALFAFYVAPILPLVVLSSAPNFLGELRVPGQRVPLWSEPFMFVLAWFYAFAPIGCGYFAARLARHQPLLHGLIVGIIGGALVALWVRGAVVFEIGLAILIVSCGLFGGWLWRYRNRKNREEP